VDSRQSMAHRLLCVCVCMHVGGFCVPREPGMYSELNIHVWCAHVCVWVDSAFQ
jgi:hypothetical protein